MTRSFPRLILAVLALHVAGASAVRSADPVELRWRFKKGDLLKYLFKHDEVRTVSINDQEFKTTTNSEYDWQWTVKDVDESGVATLEMKLAGLRVKIEGKNYDLTYDSAGANQGADDYRKKLINLFDQLRLASYTLKLKPDGRIVEVQGFDKLLGEVGNDMGVVDFNGLNLHDGTYGWFLQQALGTLPEKAVAEGGKWEVKTEAKLPEMGEVNGKAAFALGKTVKVGDKSCRELTFTGSRTVELDMRWFNNPLKGTLKSAKLAGTVCFDPQAGRLRKSEAEAEFRGELKFGDGDKPAVLKVELKHNLKLEAK